MKNTSIVSPDPFSVTGYTYNTNDQLLVVSGLITNWYDANGALTNRTSPAETNAFVYDLQNRLTSAVIQRKEGTHAISEIVNYTYDYKGNRVRSQWTRSVDGAASANGTNIFLNEPNSPDGLNQILEEMPAVGASPTVTYTLGTRVVSQSKGGTISHLMSDGHGSTRQLSDSGGTVKTNYTYDTFGKGLDFTNATQSPCDTELLYGGEQLDPDLLQIYLRARYYDPTMGRFNQIDPFRGNQQSGANLYTYCDNDPINGVDPKGLYEMDVHRYLSEFLAKSVGFSDEEANGIGNGAQDPDRGSRSATKGLVNWANMIQWHFVSKSRLIDLASQISGSGGEFYRSVGSFLHAQEDTYAHSTGIDDRNWYYYSSMGILPGGLPIGHGAHFHDPDFTWTHPEKAMRMAEKVYDDLENIRSHQDTYDNPAEAAEPIIPGNDWYGIETVVKDFVYYGAHGEVNVTETLTGLDVTKTSMENKINILFPGFKLPTSGADLADFQKLSDDVGHPYGTFKSFSAFSGGEIQIGLTAP